MQIQNVSLIIKCLRKVDEEDRQIGVTIAKPAGGQCILPIEIAKGLHDGDHIICQLFCDEHEALKHTVMITKPPRMTAEEEAEIDRLIDDLVKRLDGYFQSLGGLYD